jgi:hypothetical protein
MKKTIALFSFLALTFSLSGCMSPEEKMKAEEDERLAVPIVEKYLSQNYDGAEIIETTYLERNKSGAVAVPDFGVYATGYCVSDIDYGSNDFKVIVNTDTGECWDNFSYGKMKQDIKEKIISGISNADVEDVEIMLFHKSFPAMLWAKDCMGFTKKDDDVFASENYTINVLLKCDGNIARLDYSKLKELDCKSELSVAAITFNDRYYKNTTNLDDNSYDLTLDEEYEDLYRILDEKLQIELTYDSKKGEYVWEELPYVDYECIKIGDFTFGWDANGIDVDFHQTNADRTYTEKNNTYTSVNGTAVIVTYDIATNSDNRDLFCWADEKYEGNYLILTSDGTRKDHVYSILSGYKEYGRCRRLALNKLYDGQPFILGIYTKVEK